MTETLPDALRRVAAFLAELGYPAAVIGGVAMIARARTRATEDVDLLISWPPGGVDRLLEVAAHHGFRYELSDRAFFDEGLVRLLGPGSSDMGADVIRADSPYLEELIARATELEIAGTKLRYASAEDLLLLKLEANRPIDIDDVLAIRDGLLNRLDLEYLRSKAQALGLLERLELYLGPT